MALTDSIRQAVETCFSPKDRPAVVRALSEIVDPDNAGTEYAQAATLVLGYRDQSKVQQLAGWVMRDARDVLYWLELPGEYQSGLTRK